MFHCTAEQLEFAKNRRLELTEACNSAFNTRDEKFQHEISTQYIGLRSLSDVYPEHRNMIRFAASRFVLKALSLCVTSLKL